MKSQKWIVLGGKKAVKGFKATPPQYSLGSKGSLVFWEQAGADTVALSFLGSVSDDSRVCVG